MNLIKTVRNAVGIDIESPTYEVIKKIDENTEIRKYSASKWICTREENKKASEDNNIKMFFNLFNYISGNNNQEKKISMTSPVATNYISLNEKEKIDKDSLCNKIMKFYIPSELNSNTPIPKNTPAYIQEEPEMIVATIRFGGFASIDDFIHYRNVLIEKLGKESDDYDKINIMTAGYDPPVKLINRRNEVWLRKI